jgi:hypothetical protein
MPNSNPSRNAKYLSNAQLCHAFSPKNHPLDRAKTHKNGTGCISATMPGLDSAITPTNGHIGRSQS